MRVFQDRADCCSECLAAGRATIQPKAGLVLCLLFGFDLVSLVMLTMRADRFASGPAPRFKQLSRFIFIGVFLCKLDQIQLVRLYFHSIHADQPIPPPWTSAVLCLCEVYNPDE